MKPMAQSAVDGGPGLRASGTTRGENDFVRVGTVCRLLMDAHGLARCRLEFVDDAVDYDGLWDGKSILINSKRLVEAEDICKHEIAHALTEGEAASGRDHGPQWARLAWNLAGRPRGGSPRCPQPKQLHHRVGSLKYRELLQMAIGEAEWTGEIDEQQVTITLDGNCPWIMDDALRGFHFRFCAGFGDVLISTNETFIYLNAEEMLGQIQSVYELLEARVSEATCD